MKGELFARWLDMALYMICIPVGSYLLWGWGFAVLITGICAMIEFLTFEFMRGISGRMTYEDLDKCYDDHLAKKVKEH